jgi:hypothetical protein
MAKAPRANSKTPLSGLPKYLVQVLKQLFGLGLFFVLVLINNVATPLSTPAKAL